MNRGLLVVVLGVHEEAVYLILGPHVIRLRSQGVLNQRLEGGFFYLRLLLLRLGRLVMQSHQLYLCQPYRLDPEPSHRLQHVEPLARQK